MHTETFPESGSFPEDEQPAPLGETSLEHYQPNQFIGGRFKVIASVPGGMARVYLCHDREHDYFYALKTFRFRDQVLRNPAARTQVDGEVRKWIALGEHDHIVRCYRLEVIDNLPFIVMEWVADSGLLYEEYQRQHQGEAHFLDWYARLGVRGLPLRRLSATGNHKRRSSSLAGWIPVTKEDLALALQIAQDVCAGLTHALKSPNALVHRDLKPSNILLNEQRRAKITDFGIAAEARDLVAPASIHLQGTYEYMAPEQWLGGQADQRSDVYALGCILYEMLTGHRPFEQRAPAMNKEDFRAQHLTSAPPSLGSQFPVALDEIVQRCLQKEAAARFASCLELGDEIAVLYRRLFVKSSAPAAAKAPPTLEDLNQDGFTYFGLGNYPLALERFSAAIALNSSHPNAYNNRGCVHHELGNYPAAIKDYADAVRLGRAEINATPRNNRGLVFLMLQQPERARSDFNKAIAEDSAYANAYVNRGLANAQLGRYPEAEQDYSQAIALNQTHPLAYHNRGYLFQQLGRLPEAEADYSAALQHDPAFVQARINRYLLRQHRGEAALAEEDRVLLLRLLPAVAPQQWQAGAQISKPDPLFMNTNRYDDLIQNSFRQMQLAKRINKALWEQRAPSDRMPLRAVVRVQEIAYSNELHATIQHRLAQGERLAQATAQISLIHSYSRTLGDDLPSVDRCEILIDQEAMMMMEAEGMLTLSDLRRHMLVLDNENPDDPDQPLRIWNVM